MSNIGLILEERAANIGNFMVGRLLPFKEKRMVGPFAFIDHMGPVHMANTENLDIPPHPHIGLSTLTFLFEGSIIHKDSLGSEVEILPGAVNWMTAGKGVVHSERTPKGQRTTDKMMHGLQIWVALPKHLENMDPTFTHIDEPALPTWQHEGLTLKLIAGECFGKKSPVPVYSPLYLIEIKSTKRQMVSISKELFGESALYILNGSVHHEGTSFEPKHLLIAKEGTLCEFEIGENSTVYIFGGEPFPEERFIFWNFVASEKETIEQAKQKWIEQSFPKVPGETDFVPMPDMLKHSKL